MPTWMKLGGALIIGALIVSTKGQIFVQAGDALQKLTKGLFGG